MRYARLLVSRWLPGALALGAALAVGCHGRVGDTGNNTGTGGTITGVGGAGGMDPPCTGPADPRLVVAPQRVILLTSNEVINTVRYLFNDTIATQLVTNRVIGVTSSVDRSFPPADGEPVKSIPDATTLRPFDNLAQTVAKYVFDNFAAVTACTTATDTCAQTYLNQLAAKAYRRQLKPEETQRFGALYTKLKSQALNGYEVVTTVQQATQYSVYALLMTPQMIWRWEIGNPATASTSPPGIYLTDDELASNISFFLTDNPPDAMLLAEARAGTLRTNMAAHVTRLLATQPAKDWLRTIIETFYLLNQLPTATVDATKFPLFSAGLLNDMGIEARMFLDHTLWNGQLTDLLTSRTAFLNSYLATNIYKVTPPAGATNTNFVQTTLPADQRAGILTNAGFLTRAARPEGLGMLIPRGKVVKAAFLCLITPGPDLSKIGEQVEAGKGQFDKQTGQEQVASRMAIPLCKSCHASMDPYGLVLEYYDVLGTYRTTYDYLPGVAIDGTTPLPADVGGGSAANAVELAQKLSTNPAFTNCMATSVLQYAMVDASGPVQLPTPSQAGCAAADVAQRYQSGSAKTFTGLVNAVVSSPTFVVRSVVQ